MDKLGNTWNCWGSARSAPIHLFCLYFTANHVCSASVFDEITHISFIKTNVHVIADDRTLFTFPILSRCYMQHIYVLMSGPFPRNTSARFFKRNLECNSMRKVDPSSE